MAEWIPSYQISGGLYGGMTTPSGDLSSFFDHCTSVSEVDNCILGQATLSDTPENPNPNAAWPGAFGSSANKLRVYSEQHQPGESSIFDLYVFTIKNPEGAQFYKQELVVEGSTYYYRDIEFNYSTVTIYFIFRRIYRRVYDTPTAIPRTTHTFYNGSYGFNAIYIVDGDAPSEQLCKKYYLPVSYCTVLNKYCLAFGQYIYSEKAHETEEGGSWLSGDYYKYAGVAIPTNILAAAFGGDFGLDEEDDPYIDPDPPEPGDNPPPAPGDREKDYDPVPIPPVPGLTALGAGFLSLYSPSATLLNLFANELYSDNVLQIISNYFSNVADMIAGLAIVPFFVPISGFYKHRIGMFTTDIAFPKVSSQFIDVDCGSVDVKHFYNAFLDYAPNTKIMIWLPYIGYQELNADEVMNTVISVKYRCDILSGACIAFVSITGGAVEGVTRVIAQFSGNVLTQVPAAAASYDSMVSSAINILTASVGIAAGAAIGGAGAGMAGAAAAAAPSNIGAAVGAQVGLGMAGTAGNAIMSMKPNVVRNGTPGSTTGYMGVQKPYLIKIVPRAAVAPNHIQLKGYPSNYGGTLASLSGYCEVSEIQLSNCPAEVDEKTEIYSLLKGGVII
jgi:hypothetical protein